MTVPPRSPAHADGDTAGSQPPLFDTPQRSVAAADGMPVAAAPAPAYADFATALNGALRNFHRPDLLGRSPLLRWGSGYLGPSAGPPELQALLFETAGTLFANPRDEKLRRVIELTYFQPALKQEAVAEQLSLPFSTYRRYLTAARDRLARWLWDGLGTAAANDEAANGETAVPAAGPESATPRLSLVVLPLVNIGGKPEHDQHVDGITETLTTDLSRYPGVFVISRNTALAYKGKPADIRQIGRDLGVRYVLEGSAQKDSDRLRINAQLVDAESGVHVWADRFDKPLAAYSLDTQDEVTARLARAVHVEMIAAESRRIAREHPDRHDSVDHMLRGWASWNEPLSLEAARRARCFFETALQLDQNNIGALLGLANALIWEVRMFESPDRPGQICAAEAAATKALTLAPDSADAHVAYGTVLFAMRAPDRALREFEFALRLNRNLAVAHGYLGLMKFFLGRAEETRGHAETAMRLNPRDPLLFHWHYLIGIADLYLGRVVRGLENLRKSVEINPNWGLSQFVLAGALGLAGLLAEAAETCATAQRLAPSFTIARFRVEALSDNPTYLAQRERLYEGLRLAGAPEG